MAISLGPKLGLVINAATAEVWDTALRQLLRAMDQFPFLSVKSQALSAPPVSPANGDAYIAGPSSTGDWAGNDGSVAVWTTDNPLSPGGVWEFYHPKAGWLAYSEADSGYVVFAGGAWSLFSSAGVSIVALEITSPHPSDPDFVLPHGLGVPPRAVIPVSNGGLVYLQSPFADDTNIKLTSSDPSITGWAFVIR